ncbi:vegetative cell wall protein gp1-like [Musa acuminata AAA Group]|uniref:vegetative cell wall protein gp1-like n=1 Tax=Musa acuminata AAA Group TaxID=214697 RepID=UPI0031D8D75D
MAVCVRMRTWKESEMQGTGEEKPGKRKGSIFKVSVFGLVAFVLNTLLDMPRKGLSLYSFPASILSPPAVATLRPATDSAPLPGQSPSLPVASHPSHHRYQETTLLVSHPAAAPLPFSTTVDAAPRPPTSPSPTPSLLLRQGDSPPHRCPCFPAARTPTSLLPHCRCSSATNLPLFSTAATSRTRLAAPTPSSLAPLLPFSTTVATGGQPTAAVAPRPPTSPSPASVLLLG